MNENTRFTLFGLIVGGVLAGACAYIYMHRWIRTECAEEGPDYIKSKWGWPFMWSGAFFSVALALFCLFDRYHHALVLAGIHLIPPMRNDGDPQFISGTLWLGALGGMVIGDIAGCLGAVLQDPKSRCILAARPNQKT